MLARLPVVAALALCVLPPPAPRGVELRFAPKEGLALRKQVRFTSSTEVVGISSTTNGEERDNDQHQVSELEVDFAFTDRYLTLDEDRVTRLERTYEELEIESRGEHEFGDQTMEMSGSATNELADLTVLFEWDDEDEEYVASCEEADEEWLEELEPLRDYRILLPDDEVDRGDEWTIAAEDFRPLLKPHGDLPLEWEQERDGESVDPPDPDDEDRPEVEESESGEVTARFDGSREVDGLELAVIHLEGELESERTVESTSDNEHGTSTFTITTRGTLELEGELLWDVAGGHLHSMSLEGSFSSELHMESVHEMFDQSFETESESESTGDLSLEIHFEHAD